ncbi:hypothetical protein HOLDEFILI_02891 [Holdemania filiformis DSM 12042]|uniref:Uncharacterized protein n=1 Tax=Holdemania filiformis DSM 12042 TaxID=545696 RepID=B9YAN3_9FIRM|nr:hypothetical protein HOLDEFILI_02891 [Holdemania filiformis DSM 12042]
MFITPFPLYNEGRFQAGFQYGLPCALRQPSPATFLRFRSVPGSPIRESVQPAPG